MNSSSWSFCPGRSSLSNAERFLLSVTPDVPSRTLSLQNTGLCSLCVKLGESSQRDFSVKDSKRNNDVWVKGAHCPRSQGIFVDAIHSIEISCFDEVINSQWLPLGKDTVEYFALKDLWDCYERWSAMGAGTPLVLENGHALTQYYVPYLSAIQIYSTKSVAASRNRREDMDVVEFECDSWSEDSGSDNLSRSLSNNSSKAWDAVSLDSSCDQVGSWPTRDMLGHLYLQYTETSPPWLRIPFAEKITELAKSHPALMTLKSVDISPASWMAVAWYPIYAIPNHVDEKELGACFLTYHTLSSSFQDCTNKYDDNDIGKDISCFEEWGGIVGERLKKKNNNGFISLSPFGLATYKMQRSVWLNSSDKNSPDNERIYNLNSAADSWLKQLNVHHHDFNFFTHRCPL